ncbi:uncharacterized protein LOC127836083 isoform X1 [Dreissena polymorpha]|nr:uncharacterized protein LOC127836083 isoform X1 [Dreissena polymorpha]
MASLADVFTEKERTNWLKAWLAVDIAKSGLEQFAENEAKSVHINIYNNVLSSVPAPAVCNLCNTANLLQCPTQGICNKRGAKSACTAMHDTAAKQPRPCPDNVCNKVLNEIEKQHKYAIPSWKNTTATLWASTPWQIAKAYLPPDGYSGKSSIQDTDFNGIISFMMNCKHFNTKFSFPIAAGKNSPPCLLTKARDIGRIVRHSSQCKLTDADLQDIFKTLTNLLSDPTCLAQDVASQEAVKKLAKLQNDGLKITTEEMIHLLLAVDEKLKTVDTIAEKTLAEIRIHTDKCKRELDEHTERRKLALDRERDYEQSCEDFLGRLKEYYKKRMKMLPVSPMWHGREKPITDIFVPIQFHRVSIEKNGSRRDTEQKVETYKDMFYTNNALNDRVSIQGDPGMGKTTFLAKLVNDWCDSDSKNPEPSSKFSDVETLQNFRFLFHIKLRDSFGQRKVVDMIKTQIIDEIYINEKQQREAYDVLGSILERETCLVTMDGLNEWTDHTNGNPIPKMYTLSQQCVVLTTSRPWKMADKRILDSEIGTLIEAVGITDTQQLMKNMLRSLTEDDQESYKECLAYVEERNLKHFLASPWMLTLLVNLWVDKTFLSGSLCEINKILIYTLFNKELPNEVLTELIPSEKDVFENHTEICKALARMAFHYTLGSKRSLVFSKDELLGTKILSNEQLKFAIKSGVLNERHCFSAASCKPQVSFVHETIQEFFAASHIANFSEDKITDVFSKRNYNVLEISQVIIYLSGLKCEIANKVINHLTEDLLNTVNKGLGYLFIGSYNTKTTLTFRETVDNTNTKLNSKIGINLSSDMRCLVISMLLQEMMISCYHEAKVSRQKHICLKMRDFTFHAYLNKNTNDDLLDILMMNKSNVRTLLLERNVLPENNILTCLQQSKHCIERLKTSVTRGIISALHNLNLKQLTLIGNKDVSLFTGLLPSLGNLRFLRIEESDFYEDMFPLSDIEYLCLLKSRCSVEFVVRLLLQLSQINHLVRCNLGEVYTTEKSDFYIAKLRPRIVSCDMSKVHLCLGEGFFVTTGSKELFEILRDTVINIGILDLRTADSASLASEILHTLNKLTTLYLWGTYTGRCDLKMPASLQCISLQSVECSSEWLCSLWITLSSLDHQVECELCDVVLKSNEEARGNESHSYLLDLRSELLAHDMSNIEIFVKSGSKEQFEILRDTSIGILNLPTADSASLASEILHTLNKLTKLYLRGTYTGRCDLKMPASLQCISLQSVECSSEWLCSLWITLCSLDHQVECELWDVVLKSNEEARGNESHSYLLDMRSELLAHDMSNIEIFVKTGSKKLFEILRDASIGILNLKTADCASLASEILHTLNKLTKLYLWGTYTGRCDLKLPASLQCIRLQSVECSSEWLCSFLITLSEVHHQVECTMFNFLVKTSDTESGIETDSTVIRSELLSCDLSHVKLNVEHNSRVPFELIRSTNIDSLLLTANDDASLDVVTQSSLTMLKEICFKGIHMTRFDHKLPFTLQFMILCDGYCSPDWLKSLMIHLSTLGHTVRLYLYEYALVSSGESNAMALEPPILKCEDFSNVKLELMKDSPGLYETSPTINITSLNMTQIERPDILSQTLPLLTHLQQLRMCLKQYTVMKLPASIKYVFIIYTTFSPSSLQHFVQDMYTAQHNVQCKLLFRVEGNEDDYTRIKHEVRKLESVEMQKFEVVDKRHFRGAVAAAATLSATADEADDDFDKHLLRREGYVDSRTWLHYCKIRLKCEFR